MATAIARRRPVPTENDVKRARASSIVLSLKQALPALRRAARDLPADRAAALTDPIDAEIARQCREAPTSD